MASPHPGDDDCSLSDSTYEIIPRDSTDEGSLDGHTDSISESFSELDRYPNVEEVQVLPHGLDAMSNSVGSAFESDSEPDDDASPEDAPLSGQEERAAHSYHDADELLRSSFTQASIPRPFPPTSTGSIEFSEPEDVDVHIDKISVKHTIREFTEEEATHLLHSLDLTDVPNRLCATIRQTMSQRCLSTHEAFRVLYLGNESMKGEIILKISRAITCSSSVDYNENKVLRRNTEGVYNIVPVTFGAVKDRDVELMEASAFQIKVDTCVDADKIPIEGAFFSDDIVYSLTVDGGNGGKKYKSVPAGGPEGAQVQPAWSLPHVAVIYCCDFDDAEMRSTQQVTWEFCKRHAIPCLYISDHSALVSPVVGRWRNYTNEHAVHLSLESREAKSRESGWSEQRFPIDLTSFLNIDNRQMNQNLAYLTGLQEPPAVADEKVQSTASLGSGQRDIPDQESKEWKAYAEKFLEPYLQLMEDYRYFSLLCSVALLLLVAVSAWLINVITPTPISNPAGYSGVNVLLETPAGITTATATVTVSHTSTKTVKLATAETPAFGGLLSDLAYTVSSEPGPKDSVCTVEMYSGNEILLKLPSGTKTSWLAKGAIEVDVFRGNSPVKSRLSSIDEGILVEINSKDAYGVVNVSVVTTRKPKINETFAIDFGTSTLLGVLEAAKVTLEEVAQMLSDKANDAANLIEVNYASSFASTEESVRNEVTSWWEAIKDTGHAARTFSSGKAGETFDRVKDSFQSGGIFSYLDDARQTLTEQRARVVEDAANFRDGARQTFMEKRDRVLEDAAKIRDDLDLAVLKAQITSKLWWLKAQGKSDEHDEYERQARSFIKKKRHEALKTKQLREASVGSSKCPRTGDSPCRCKNKGLSRWKV
ncbi:hypothetical protein J7T55_007483 [Diaporthe amygdali]|uniref:uncharacterized protein n=1 Tax=Phomopsis amygdali TaxID=1214568 RepID=UPI0022FDD812|nr:uncharacterized protein J7T55_007483 [Diaporthe amygdali]KAJ0116503.1 hypothetical protein J7T55_007483 [Diaporthe amygdali]